MYYCFGRDTIGALGLSEMVNGCGHPASPHTTPVQYKVDLGYLTTTEKVVLDLLVPWCYQATPRNQMLYKVYTGVFLVILCCSVSFFLHITLLL